MSIPKNESPKLRNCRQANSKKMEFITRMPSASPTPSNGPHTNGYITIYMGNMFSGKTSELIRNAKRFSSIGKKILMINHSLDDRYTDKAEVVNHDGVSFPCLKAQTLLNIDVTGAEAIFVNEGQFFPDLVTACQLWADELQLQVFVCGLDGDFKRGVFGSLLSLIPLADEVHKLHAYCFKCKDGTLAPFSKRITTEDDQISIGASNYIAVCRKHYLEN
jgi:thymidine kinase